ncbi:hypothetical protein E3N88_21651 [Mikania micrantha]|uniref:Peptidase A1 domain-containing protein n=1 Tax=Mikania micrantha TaxID=192012 RepID=A0A5N6NA06_9ASTR|nr:hypothetical protein E3N88_21651 [Mikania micrantha]
MDACNRGFVLVFRVFVVVVAVLQLGCWVSANVVFQVQHKFTGDNNSLTAFKAHDSYRHRRILADADLPLGGDSSPSSVALYFTKIQIGTPPRDYHVQVDTASDILWVNCAGCVNCPQKSDLGIPLTLYDPMHSSTSRFITCDQDFCTATLDPSNNECILGTRCSYVVRYGDGSSTTGYFVRDDVQLARISGDLQTSDMKGNIMFGCGARQSGGLGKSQQALDGILGFGESNSSLISQLASSKKVKKMFSHCLSGSKGGIFAIGEVVHPKVNSTPILPNMAHFTIELKAIEVGGEFIRLPTDIFNTAAKRGTIIDSGTTLAYFPEEVHSQIIKKIMASQPNANIYIADHQFTCYKGLGNVDDSFPTITFHFADVLKLKLYPHQYIFKTHRNYWCIGFLSNGNYPRQGRDSILLGDIVLTDRLVTYNMEDRTLGWTEYDCSSSIKVRDEESGMIYTVGAHDISYTSGAGRANGSVFVLLLFVITTIMVMH